MTVYNCINRSSLLSQDQQLKFIQIIRDSREMKIPFFERRVAKKVNPHTSTGHCRQDKTHKKHTQLMDTTACRDKQSVKYLENKSRLMTQPCLKHHDTLKQTEIPIFSPIKRRQNQKTSNAKYKRKNLIRLTLNRKNRHAGRKKHEKM